MRPQPFLAGCSCLARGQAFQIANTPAAIAAWLASLAPDTLVVFEADEKFFCTSFKGSRGWKKKDFPQMRRARRRGGAGVRGLGEQQVPTLTAVDRTGHLSGAGSWPETRHHCSGYDALGGKRLCYLLRRQ